MSASETGNEPPPKRAVWASYKIFGDALQGQLAERVAAMEEAKRAAGFDETTSRTYASEASAQSAFGAAADALLDPARWGRIWGAPSAPFALFTESGRPTGRHAPEAGDFVRDEAFCAHRGASWSRLEALERDEHRLSLTLRPAHDPSRRPPTPGVTCHFLTRAATIRFTVERKGERVVARVEVAGCQPNTGDEAGGRITAMKNDTAARLADAGFWKKATEVLIES